MKRSAFGDRELHTLQRNTFNYFWKETNPENGLLADNTIGHTPASIAAIGLALPPTRLARRRRAGIGRLTALLVN